VGGDALHVLNGKGWRHAAAAVGARKAVGFGPHFLIDLVGVGIEQQGRVVFELGQNRRSRDLCWATWLLNFRRKYDIRQ
jgi:hypothetical protein